MLDGPVQMTGSIKMPGYPPTLVAVTGGEKPDVLDQPDDQPADGETLHLYAYSGFVFVDYRGRNAHLSGKYGMYHVVPEGAYKCLDCGRWITSPPPWPFERCTHWRSGFHRIEAETPAVMEVALDG